MSAATEREFWLEIRRQLLRLAAQIEERYARPKQ